MIVVTGATGNIGRTLTQLLTSAGAEVVGISHEAAPADTGITYRTGLDTSTVEGMREAVAGADALFLMLGGAQNAFGGDPAELVGAAVEAGVKRIVLNSSQASATRPQAASHARLRAFEEAVRASGVEWTILRPSGFASNAFAWLESVRTQRTVYAPYGDVAWPVVDPADIAGMAAVALLEDGHVGRVYTVTGPVAVTPREQAAVLSAALGEDVAFVELSREQALEAMSAYMPAEIAAGTLDITKEPLPEESRISPDVAALLGRPAGDFAGWVARSVEAFR
ncbi:NmrA family transcriptional regulator [Actinorhabdospora filicis]|uniref:NmrA family transcriptional regulator n=1 Tax=Actinorhabdospora filicis TaxID=1785913 RepID=A0A9W6SKW4_9ACTN|nr:NAD(P)H-binding protein [Actinorhabdospora filicis]GLZ77611.1 NmrA family transcriptional regulator [Actinorhabdospora filicis]